MSHDAAYAFETGDETREVERTHMHSGLLYR